MDLRNHSCMHSYIVDWVGGHLLSISAKAQVEVWSSHLGLPDSAFNFWRKFTCFTPIRILQPQVCIVYIYTFVQSILIYMLQHATVTFFEGMSMTYQFIKSYCTSSLAGLNFLASTPQHYSRVRSPTMFWAHLHPKNNNNHTQRRLPKQHILLCGIGTPLWSSNNAHKAINTLKILQHTVLPWSDPHDPSRQGLS